MGWVFYQVYNKNAKYGKIERNMTMELSIRKIMHYLNNQYEIIITKRDFVEHDLEKEEQKKVRDEKYIRELEDDYNFKDGQVDMLTKIIKDFKVIEMVEWRWCERKEDKC